MYFEEHLLPYFWVVPSLFQEATCSDLIFSKVLCYFLQGIELIFEIPFGAIYLMNGSFLF